MGWSDLHGRLLARAFENLLGASQRGTMAFVRCLTPDVVGALVNNKGPGGRNNVPLIRDSPG